MSEEPLQQFKDLLVNPRESLGVELKEWLDPASDEGKAKIAKACIALRNNDGGVLVVGIGDDGTPDSGNQPDDVRAAFHWDVVQGIVSKYSSEQFEVVVDFVEKDGVEYPIIRVPSGVETPVACKADLPGDGALLKTDRVYVRTLHANMTVSSSEVRWKDWEPLVRRCFDNREADIGAFVRRHLSGLDIEQLVTALRGQGARREISTSRERAVDFLDEGYGRFQQIIGERGTNFPVELGTSEASVVIEGDFASPDLTDQLLWRLESSTPRHTGWPPFAVTAKRYSTPAGPHVLEDGWQELLAAESGLEPVDFWRIEPRGRFYCVQTLMDDVEYGSPRPKPYTTIDFKLQIRYTTEVLSAAFSFAKVFGCAPEETKLAFAVRWRNLKGRTLSSWADLGHVFPVRGFLAPRGPAHQNEKTTSALIPLDTPLTALTPHVEELVQPLFALFDGLRLQTEDVEAIVQATLRSRV